VSSNSPAAPHAAAAAAAPRWLVPALSLLFFGSGISALIYQVLWLRLLGLTFGVTIYAASAVWASFMAGLAIGSAAAGALGDRVRNPLRWFGACELLVGVTAFATPATLDALQHLYVVAYPSLPHSLPLLTAARFAMAGLVLVVPTALMGATLPLVIKSTAFESAGLGRHIGVLYGVNTAGAIAGTMAAGLYLIPGPGIHRTFVIAAAVNAVVGAGAILLGRAAASAFARAGFAPDGSLPQADTADRVDDGAHDRDWRAAESMPTPRQRRTVLLVFAGSGFTSLALEVVWFRVLTLFLRPTVYGFAVMLATILAGIAIGSWIAAAVVERRARWVGLLALLEFAIGIAAVLSFRPLVALSATSNALFPALSRVMPDYLVYPIAGSLLAIFPTALLLGVAFPIGLRLWSIGGRDVAGRVGMFYAANVAASIFGSLAAGFVLLPRFGSQTSLAFLATLIVASGFLLLHASAWTARTRAVVAVVAAAAFGAALWQNPDPFDQFVAQRYPRQQILWREEGVDATVVVHRSGRGELSLTVNGNHQASTGPSMTYDHHRIGHLPMALHPNAREALVIGLGGGATAGAVSIHEGVGVDVVELSASVVRGAHFFGDINYGLFSRPNVHLRVDDGRNFMMLTPKRYDVVTADVIHPIYAGSGNLYSQEYFRLIRHVLKPGGLVVQWCAGTEAEYKTIARTFLSVFPNTTAWADGSLLVGSVEPLRLRRADFDWKLEMPGRAQGMRDLGATSFDELLKMYFAGPKELLAFVGPGPVLTDDRPLVEYFLSLPRNGDVDLRGVRGDVRDIVSE
jgi:spermidine synthase